MNFYINLLTLPLSSNFCVPPVQAGCDLESISSFNVSPSLIVDKSEIDWFFDCLKNSFNYGLNKLIIKFLKNALVK